jgi:hypothetical protein
MPASAANERPLASYATWSSGESGPYRQLDGPYQPHHCHSLMCK